MKKLPVRGLIAPVCIALAIAAGVLELRIDSLVLRWLGLGFLAVGLIFARDSRNLLSNAFRDRDDG